MRHAHIHYWFSMQKHLPEGSQGSTASEPSTGSDQATTLVTYAEEQSSEHSKNNSIENVL